MKVLNTFALAALLGACGTGASQAEPESPRPSTVAQETPESETAPGPTSQAVSDPDYRAVQPGAPGEATRELAPDELSSMDVPGHTEADARFMQGMIPHHAQAIEMVDLMPGRTENPVLVRLGQRITISQRDEIALMQRWLRERGEDVPMAGAGHAGMDHGAMGHDMGLMPGMLTPEQMSQLAAAQGSEFDRLFLEFMIMHHEGARYMVRELFSTPGGGQESFTYQFASDVDADQQMEIRRMRQMLEEIP